MRLKLPDENTVVHCATEEEAELFVGYACVNGYAGPGNGTELNWWDHYKAETCYHLRKGKVCYATAEYYRNAGYRISEFRDLLLPDAFSEDELRDTLERICVTYQGCSDCPLRPLFPQHRFSAPDCIRYFDEILDVCRKHGVKSKAANARCDNG